MLVLNVSWHLLILDGKLLLHFFVLKGQEIKFEQLI